tara:strand:+ start:66 stop:971 length:906 start_codon:yes stop_codon:yes gene_type:complete
MIKRNPHKKLMERVRSSAQSAEDKGQIHGRKEPLEIGITWEDIKEQFEKQSGYEYYLLKIGIKRKIDLDRVYNSYDQLSPSIDRIDSSKGYILGNFVITFRYLNLGKGPISEDEFVKILKYAHFGDNPNKINYKSSNINIGENMKNINDFDMAIGRQLLKENNRELYTRAREWASDITINSSGIGAGLDTPHGATVRRADDRANIILDKAVKATNTDNLVSVRELASRYFPTMPNPDYSIIIGGAPGNKLANGCNVWKSNTLDVSAVQSDLSNNRDSIMDKLFVDEQTAKDILNNKTSKVS